MIVIIDYGMGNLWSVANAIKKYTKDALISSDPKDIESADKVVLPGVGAFEDAYNEIKMRGLIEPIFDAIKKGKPFLGICLGMQLLFTKSYENGEHDGFNIIEGEILPFSESIKLKIPHMGWNNIIKNSKFKMQNCPLLKKVPNEAYMYFVHSYYAKPKDSSIIAATTEYGIEFCSFLCKENIYAVQFHPEKSQQHGLKIIENFVLLRS